MIRPHQQFLKQGVFEAWEEVDNVMAVLPTGGGKTYTMASISAELDDYLLACAHRKELVGQIAMAHAAAEVPHRIIAPADVIKSIIDRQVEDLGRSWYNPGAPVAIAGIDTLIKRQDDFFDKVKWGHMDEGHHPLVTNKWGRGMAMLPNAKWALWTATPRRADGKSLRFGVGGLAHRMIVGPTMRELINQRYLTDFKIYGVAKGSIDLSEVTITAGGDFNAHQLAKAAHKSAITGDIVQHYHRLTPGMQACVFAVDVSIAHEHAQAFTDAGYPAQVVHGAMAGRDRDRIIRAFERKQFPVLVNVDILGEGFDCPGIEVVIFARPTASFPLYVQQFGRVLRVLAGKLWGIILDAVGNVLRHGLPDGHIDWSLDAPDRKKKPREIPARCCANPDCLLVWEGFEPCCPYCGWKPEYQPKERARPEVLEGDLTEYTPEMLASLRREADRIIGEPEIPFGASAGVQRAVVSKWRTRRNAQLRLRDNIASWAGYWRDVHQATDAASYRRFYHEFGMDVGAAQKLSAREAAELADRIEAIIGRREEAA